jgi:hypothetical protein
MGGMDIAQSHPAQKTYTKTPICYTWAQTILLSAVKNNNFHTCKNVIGCIFQGKKCENVIED